MAQTPVVDSLARAKDLLNDFSVALGDLGHKALLIAEQLSAAKDLLNNLGVALGSLGAKTPLGTAQLLVPTLEQSTTNDDNIVGAPDAHELQPSSAPARLACRRCSEHQLKCSIRSGTPASCDPCREANLACVDQ